MSTELQDLIKIAMPFACFGCITFTLLNIKIVIDLIFKLDEESRKARERNKKEIIDQYEKERKKKENGQ